jgi:hypothetical protein
MDRKSVMLAVAAGMAVAWAAGSAGAEESTVTVVKAGSPLSAMKVVRDKDTGQLRPATADEMAQMGKASTPGYAPAIVVLSHPVTTAVTHPDGSTTVRRSLDDLDKLMVAPGKNGERVMGHDGKGAPDNASKPKE